MALVLRVGQELVDQVLRVVLAHGDLLDDDALLPLQVLPGELRVQNQVLQKADAAAEVFLEDLGVKAGALLGGEGVGRAAEAVHLVGQGRGVLVLCALEDHVLHKVGVAVLRGGLVDRAGAHEYAHGHRVHGLHALADDPQAVVQCNPIVSHFVSPFSDAQRERCAHRPLLSVVPKIIPRCARGGGCRWSGRGSWAWGPRRGLRGRGAPRGRGAARGASPR